MCLNRDKTEFFLAPGTPTVLLQPLVVTADFIMLYTGYSTLTHGTIVPHTVFWKLTFFLNQYI